MTVNLNEHVTPHFIWREALLSAAASRLGLASSVLVPLAAARSGRTFTAQELLGLQAESSGSRPRNTLPVVITLRRTRREG